MIIQPIFASCVDGARGGFLPLAYKGYLDSQLSNAPCYAAPRLLLTPTDLAARGRVSRAGRSGCRRVAWPRAPPDAMPNTGQEP